MPIEVRWEWPEGGPGALKLIRTLTEHQGDFEFWMPTPNGYGISIIRTQPTMVEIPGYEPQLAGGSIGARAGLYEVALLRHGDICFNGPILREPEGYLSPREVLAKLREIFELPAAR